MNVLPIGHYVGVRHPEGLHHVRLGTQHQTMTEDEFGVWVLAHSEDPKWTVEDVLSLAAKADLPDAAAAVARLTAAGLLVSEADPVDFAHRYRLRSLMVGLGNTPEQPDVYALGFPGLPPAALVDEGSYELWQWAALTPSLWHTCEVRAKATADSVSATDLVPDVLAELRPLLANSCAYLDPVVRPR